MTDPTFIRTYLDELEQEEHEIKDLARRVKFHQAELEMRTARAAALREYLQKIAPGELSRRPPREVDV